MHILVFSGRQDARLQREMLRAGADQYVVKTGRVRPLLEALDRAFAVRARARRAADGGPGRGRRLTWLPGITAGRARREARVGATAPAAAVIVLRGRRPRRQQQTSRQQETRSHCASSFSATPGGPACSGWAVITWPGNWPCSVITLCTSATRSRWPTRSWSDAEFAGGPGWQCRCGYIASTVRCSACRGAPSRSPRIRCGGPVTLGSTRLLMRCLQAVRVFGRPDLMVIDQPLLEYLIRPINPHRVLYRPTDINLDPQTRAAEDRFIPLASGVVATSGVVADALAQRHPDQHFTVVQNGCADSSFRGARCARGRTAAGGVRGGAGSTIRLAGGDCPRRAVRPASGSTSSGPAGRPFPDCRRTSRCGVRSTMPAAGCAEPVPGRPAAAQR